MIILYPLFYCVIHMNYLVHSTFHLACTQFLISLCELACLTSFVLYTLFLYDIFFCMSHTPLSCCSLYWLSGVLSLYCSVCLTGWADVWDSLYTAAAERGSYSSNFWHMTVGTFTWGVLLSQRREIIFSDFNQGEVFVIPYAVTFDAMNIAQYHYSLLFNSLTHHSPHTVQEIFSITCPNNFLQYTSSY